MPGYDKSYPGELNQFAQVDAELCLEFNLSGMYGSEKDMSVVVPMNN